MLSFHLFRIKVYAPLQANLFGGEFSPQLTLAETLRLKPVVEVRQGSRWHIGNLEQLDIQAVYFALGRTTRSTLELYDEGTGNFLEREFETAPYTHVVCDTALEVCGIANKTQLAPTVQGIARQLERILNSTAKGPGAHRFEVSAISDPAEFIQQIREAYAVKNFSLSFTLPNPFDVDRDFTEPMQRLLRDAQGKQGKTSLKGDNLDAGVLEELARTAATTGNQAEAKIQRSKSSRPVKRRLEGDVATITEEEPSTLDERRGVLHEIRNLYARIRNSQTK